MWTQFERTMLLIFSNIGNACLKISDPAVFKVGSFTLSLNQ